MVSVGDEAVGHKAMDETVEGVLKCRSRIEVPAQCNRMVCCKDYMGHIRPHDAGKGLGG